MGMGRSFARTRLLCPCGWLYVKTFQQPLAERYDGYKRIYQELRRASVA